MIINLFITIPLTFLLNSSPNELTTTLILMYFLIILIPSISLSVRRLHDIGKSGTWYLIRFIPMIGKIYFLILVSKKGQPFENEYGVEPESI